MARVIPPGYAEVSQELRLDGYPRSAFVTYGVKILGTGVALNALAGQLYAKYVAAWQTSTDSNVTMGRCRVVVGQDGGEPLVEEHAGTTKGSSNRESVSPALAVMMSKVTGLGGRRNRGRMFMPWAIRESNVDEAGVISSDEVDFLQGNASFWIVSLTANSDPSSLTDGMVLLHGPGLGTPTPVTSMIVSPVISTQRRRQTRR